MFRSKTEYSVESSVQVMPRCKVEYSVELAVQSAVKLPRIIAKPCSELSNRCSAIANIPKHFTGTKMQ